MQVKEVPFVKQGISQDSADRSKRENESEISVHATINSKKSVKKWEQKREERVRPRCQDTRTSRAPPTRESVSYYQPNPLCTSFNTLKTRVTLKGIKTHRRAHTHKHARTSVCPEAMFSNVHQGHRTPIRGRRGHDTGHNSSRWDSSSCCYCWHYYSVHGGVEEVHDVVNDDSCCCCCCCDDRMHVDVVVVVVLVDDELGLLHCLRRRVLPPYCLPLSASGFKWWCVGLCMELCVGQRGTNPSLQKSSNSRLRFNLEFNQFQTLFLPTTTTTPITCNDIRFSTGKTEKKRWKSRRREEGPGNEQTDTRASCCGDCTLPLNTQAFVESLEGTSGLWKVGVA